MKKASEKKDFLKIDKSKSLPSNSNHLQKFHRKISEKADPQSKLQGFQSVLQDVLIINTLTFLVDFV
jgi:hypothetical protein